MNRYILCSSFCYVTDNFKLIASLSMSINEELKNIMYDDSKLIVAFQKFDLSIAESIITLIQDKQLTINCILSETFSDIEVVKILIKYDYIDIQQLFMFACEFNSYKLIKFLLTFDITIITVDIVKYICDNYHIDTFTLFLKSKKLNISNDIIKICCENEHSLLEFLYLYTEDKGKIITYLLDELPISLCHIARIVNLLTVTSEIKEKLNYAIKQRYFEIIKNLLQSSSSSEP